MKQKILIGTSGWTYSDWTGLFYPEQLPKSQWLEYYAQKFKTVELNATFYRNFPQKTFAAWYDRTPENFKFVIKLSRYISHRKYLLDVKSSIQLFEDSVLPLKDKLVLLLLQLPPKMPYSPERLYDALSAFSDPSRVVVEFRNQNWLTEEVKSILTKFKVIFCNIDSPSMKVYDWLTSNTGYLRLHGHNKMYNYNYTGRQLKKIALYVEDLMKHGAKEMYVFFNNDYFAYAPHNAKTLETLLIHKD